MYMKGILTVVLSATMLTACNKSLNTASTENERIVRQCYEHFNKHEWEKMAALYTETAEFKDPSLGQDVVKQSRQQIVEKYTALTEMFPDVKDEVVQIYPSGDKHIIVEFVSTGTAPDSSKFELPICTIFTIENGQIAKDFTYYDNFEEPGQK